MKRTRHTIAWVLPLLVGGGCSDATPDPNVVARAGSIELLVGEVVELLVDEESLPVDANLVEAVAQLWIDYTLLARAAAEDSTLARLDFGPMVQAALDQDRLIALRDSAIQVDTIVTSEELAARYEGSDATTRYRARHLMLQYPLQATPAQRDSVRSQLGTLRAQLADGASFEDLARRFSQDQGSAASGGDLGYFGPGEMVRPFEDAVRSMEPGQVSEAVETPMGLHLIRLEEKQRPAFEDMADQLRDQFRQERAQQAESLFVARVEERAGALSVVENAPTVVRDLATNPSLRLSSRAARRPLVEWRSGTLTAGRVLELLQLETIEFQQQVMESPDEPIEGFLMGLARRDLLVAEARGAGLEPPAARADSLTTAISEQVRGAARRLGLLPPERAPGEPTEPAVRRAVLNALGENLSGGTPSIPLGPLSYQLRAEAVHGTVNAGIGRAVLELGRQRAARGLSDSESGPAPTKAPADTGSVAP